MPNENTPHLHLPLPHPDNLLEGDVERLRSGFTLLDEHAAQIAAALAALGTSTPAPDALPKAGADGKLALGWLPEIPDPTTVLSAPAIAGGDLIVGCPASYTLTGQSYLSGAAVATFELNFNGVTQSVSAVSNTATLELTVPAGTAAGATFELTATAVDTIGNRSKSTAVSRSAIVASVKAPAITSPAAGAIVSAVSIPLTGADFASTGGAGDTQKRRRGRVCTPDGTVLFTGPWVAGVTGHVTSLTLAPSTPLTAKASVTLQIQDEGNTLGASPWSAPVAVTVASVVQPTITSPAAGATVYASGVTITTAAFSCSGGIDDIHASSDWKITSDAAGDTIVVQAMASANKVSHTFTGLSITDGGTYYLWARHNGTSCGLSPWSAACSVIIKTAIITSGGRKLYRHVSGKGTVMEFSDGQTRKVVVLDAQYRAKHKWGTYGYDMSNLTNYNTQNSRGGWYLNTSNAANTNAATVMTDAQINSLWSGSIDNKTAKQNCDQWMTRNSSSDSQSISGVPAVSYARNVSVDGAACDVPNIQTLMRIFLEAEVIDALDPTVAANRTKALGSQNSAGFWNCMGANIAWASTEYNSSYVRLVGNDGYCGGASKYYEYFVVPVQEL